LGRNIGRSARTSARARPRKVVGAADRRCQSFAAAQDFRRDRIGRSLRWVVSRPEEVVAVLAAGGQRQHWTDIGAEDLSQKINELQKNLGPEYLALLDATLDEDPNSKDGQEIVSIFDKLDSSCGD
jgi:hypothetical protein